MSRRRRLTGRKSEDRGIAVKAFGQSARSRWKAILLMTVLFFVGVSVGSSGSEPAEATAVETPKAKTVTVDGEPVTVTQTETVKKRVVKWKTKRVVRTVTETVAAPAPPPPPPPSSARNSGGGNCHESYSGCLDANASDYDCAGGSGDGPKYTGPVEVYGYDEYDLDRDGDGVGCDS
jgi:resuscitation-promoting factor RpfB